MNNNPKDPIEQEELEEKELQKLVLLTEAEKDLVRDAVRESEDHLRNSLWTLPAGEKLIPVFKEFSFLNGKIYWAVYRSGWITKFDRKNMLESAQKTADLLGLKIHPVDADGFRMSSQETKIYFDLTSKEWDDFLDDLTMEELHGIARLTSIGIQIDRPVKMPVDDLMDGLVIDRIFHPGHVLIGTYKDKEIIRVIVLQDPETVCFAITFLQDHGSMVWKIVIPPAMDPKMENSAVDDQ